MRARALVTLAAGILLAGCSDDAPTIDTSSVVAYERSMEAVRAALPEDERGRFGEALVRLALGDFVDTDGSLGGFAALAAMPNTTEGLLARMGPIIAGRTGPEVIRIAHERTEERYRRQMAAIDEEIGALVAEIAEARAAVEEAENVLDQIEVGGARYYWSDAGFRAKAIIDFRITNNSPVAIRKIVLHGILETPGRSVPWVDGNISYEFRGGLEPSESQHLRLAPNMFGDWSHSDLRDRDDLILTLRVANVEDANGERLLSVSENETAHKEERVRRLREQREELSRMLGHGT